MSLGAYSNRFLMLRNHKEWWFCVHLIGAEDFSISTKSNLMHIAPWSEDDLRQVSHFGQGFLFLKETKNTKTNLNIYIYIYTNGLRPK